MALMVLAMSAAIRLCRAHLTGIENPAMAVWPGQVIFGFYFAVLVLSVQALQSLWTSAQRRDAAPRLLLLVLVGLCLDFVLVNVQEVVTHVDASYGFVVLWDAATFFAWMRAVELCRSSPTTAFRTSVLVAIVPLFALGREIMFLPYSPLSWRAYLDLVFGNLLVSLWIFVPGAGAAQHRGRWAASLLVCMGCVYWLLNAVENIACLAWSPLGPLLYYVFAQAGLPVFLLSVLYAAIASVTTFVIWRWDALGIGSQLGIARRAAPELGSDK